MTNMSFAWMIYLLGALGCSLVAWWMFSRAWRFVRYSAVATVLVILLVPFSIDSEQTILAPVIFTLVFEGAANGLAGVHKPLNLLIGFWLMVEIILALFVYFTRHRFAATNSKMSHDQSSLNESPTDKTALDLDATPQRSALPDIDQEFDPALPQSSREQSSRAQSSRAHSNAIPAADITNTEAPKSPRKKPSVKRTVKTDDTHSEKHTEKHTEKPAAVKSKKTKTAIQDETPIRAIRD